MARNITVTFDDGSSHVYQNAPGNLTPEQVTARAQKDFGKTVAHLDGGKTAEAPQETTMDAVKRGIGNASMIGGTVDDMTTAAKNFLPSAAHLVGGIANALAHPIDTAHSMADAATGAVYNIAPGLKKYGLDDPATIQRAVQTANQVGGAYKQRYGSLQAIHNTMVSDPAGFAADLSVLLSGGAAATARVAPKASATMRTASQITNPINAITPIVTGPAKAAGKAIRGAANAMAPKTPGSIIANALTDQGTTPAEAGAMIQAGQAKGVPLALMDTGDEMRGLAGSLSRKPGPSRTIVRDAVIPRQEAQLERVQDAIQRDLGPTTNVRAQSEQLIQSAQAAAKPHYEEAYSKPVPETQTLTDLMQRPSMQGALKRAYGIAKEEGRDPKTMGFNIDPEGNVTLEKHNSMQTWDYVKRGLDDVIEANRDPVTGRLKLDEAGRAVNATQRQFLNELDSLNPAYKAARLAYGGPAKMATALNKGAKVVNKDAEAIWAETRDLPSAELEQYKLGVRSALSKMMEGRTDAADKVKALVGTPKKRAALAHLFGGTDKFDSFMQTLAHEGEAAKTHAAVNTGSPTANRLADDAQLEGLTGVAANAGKRAAFGYGMLHNSMATVADLIRYGGGEAAKRLRAQLAAGITETDPKMIARLIKEAADANAAKGNRLSGAGAITRKVGTATKKIARSPASLGAAQIVNSMGTQ